MMDSSHPMDSGSILPCEERTPTLLLGTGEIQFEPLEVDQMLTMIHGPQGGWHMLGSVRLINTKQIVEVYLTITDMDSGVTVSDNHYRVAMIMNEECDGFYPGMYGYLNVYHLAEGELDTPPELLAGHSLLFQIRANDCTETNERNGDCNREERWAEGEMTVIAKLDPIDE